MRRVVVVAEKGRTKRKEKMMMMMGIGVSNIRVMRFEGRMGEWMDGCVDGWMRKRGHKGATK